MTVEQLVAYLEDIPDDVEVFLVGKSTYDDPLALRCVRTETDYSDPNKPPVLTLVLSVRREIERKAEQGDG